ncbi:MAG: class I SAM-dependent methyltransferase, partial [Limisphaerales bacterium]
LLNGGLGADRTAFIHADALDWSPSESSFDLIVTHFFLDCFRPDQLQSLVEKLASASTPDAVWWVADFQVPASGFTRYRAAVIHRLMYLFFRVATALPAVRLTPPDAFLQAQGFVLCERVVSEWGLLHADHWRRVRFC